MLLLKKNRAGSKKSEAIFAKIMVLVNIVKNPAVLTEGGG